MVSVVQWVILAHLSLHTDCVVSGAWERGIVVGVGHIVRKQGTKSALRPLGSHCGKVFICTFRSERCIFGSSGTPCTPWMLFPSVTGKKTCGKRILLDGMAHVYLHGFWPSGSAIHISSMLVVREMWNKHFFLAVQYRISFSYLKKFIINQ